MFFIKLIQFQPPAKFSYDIGNFQWGINFFVMIFFIGKKSLVLLCSQDRSIFPHPAGRAEKCGSIWKECLVNGGFSSLVYLKLPLGSQINIAVIFCYE